jgi:hypothetical protein
MASDFENAMNRIKTSADTTKSVQKLYEDYNKKILDLETKKNNLSKVSKKDLEEKTLLEKQITDTIKERDRLIKGAEKTGISLTKKTEVDVDKQTKEIKKLFAGLNLPKEEISKGGVLADIGIGAKDKEKANKEKIETKNRLDEIEDIYREFLSETKDLFEYSLINEQEALRRNKVASIFKQVALQTLKAGKEVNKGYRQFLKETNTAIKGTSQITPKDILSKTTSQVLSGTSLNKKELLSSKLTTKKGYCTQLLYTLNQTK